MHARMLKFGVLRTNVNLIYLIKKNSANLIFVHLYLGTKDEIDRIFFFFLINQFFIRKKSSLVPKFLCDFNLIIEFSILTKNP